MSVVDDAVEDGIGVGGFADERVPRVHRRLAGDDGGAPPVALLHDLQEVLAGWGVEGGKPKIVKDKQVHPRQRPEQPGMAAVAAGKRQIAEQLGHTLVEDGAVVAAGFVAKRTGEPRLAEPSGAGDDQIVAGIDPAAGGKPLEHGPVELARMLVVDILDHGLMPEIGVFKPRFQAFVAAVTCLAVQQQAEPFGQAERGGIARGQKLPEGLGHAGKAQLFELGKRWMIEHGTSQL